MTRVGGVYRVEVVHTLERAAMPQVKIAEEIGQIIKDHMPDVLETKVEILYETIKLFEKSIDPNEVRREPE